MKNFVLFVVVILLNACCCNMHKQELYVCNKKCEELEKSIKEKSIKEKSIKNKKMEGTVYENTLKKQVNYPLGIIGEIEPVYIKNMNSMFLARIDTGAETSSIDVSNIKEFERDGESYVSFDIDNSITKEKKSFEKKIKRRVNIKRQNINEKRIVVEMEMKMGNQLFKKEFSLADREKFDYQVLIGRNVLNGLAVVDVGIKNSLN